MPSPELSLTLHTMSHEELLEHLQKEMEKLYAILDEPKDFYDPYRGKHCADVTAWAETFYRSLSEKELDQSKCILPPY